MIVPIFIKDDDPNSILNTPVADMPTWFFWWWISMCAGVGGFGIYQLIREWLNS